MKTKLLLAGIVVLLASASTASASPCFAWSCSTSSSTIDHCTFDASCSTWDKVPYGFYWVWGDGEWLFSSSFLAQHDYQNRSYAYVTFIIYFLDGTDQQVSCYIQTRNVYGPPQPTSGICQ